MLAQVERIERPLTGQQEAARQFTLSLMGLTLLSVTMKAIQAALAGMAAGRHPPPTTSRLSFDELYREVGFEEHYAWESRFGATGSIGDHDAYGKRLGAPCVQTATRKQRADVRTRGSRGSTHVTEWGICSFILS